MTVEQEQRRTPEPAGPRRPPVGVEPGQPSSAAAFLVLRRMRVPLMVLILVFAISVLGLTLVPGTDAEGQPHRLSFFDAFYFMSYTATTIGFGELPYAFSDAQRLWVVICIYLTVISWAYAIGALLTLLQSRAFRQLLAHQQFQRQVHRMVEPFVLVAGYGQTGEQLVRSFDALGRRAVVLDTSPDRIDALNQETLRSDVPGLAADVASSHNLRIAGLDRPQCQAVVALTDDDEANLAVAMAAALLRPDLPVVTRTVSATIGRRMQAFGTPIVVNPFDRFGEHLLLALRAPASHQLMTWLETGPGGELPDLGRRPQRGRWIVCGYGRFGRALTADLRGAGIDVTVIEQASAACELAVQDGVHVVQGDGSDPDVLERARLAGAVGFVAGTQNDTTNLSVAAAARRMDLDLFLIARQNSPANASLFGAMALDSLLVPTELVAAEAYAHLSTPLLWRFLQEMPAQGDAWAHQLVQDLVGHCGERLPALWKVRLTPQEAPALQRWLDAGLVRVGDLLREPESPEQALNAVVLLVLQGDTSVLRPEDDLVLQSGDELLLAGTAGARWSMDNTLALAPAAEQLLTGERQPVGWLWRRLAGAQAPSPEALRRAREESGLRAGNE